MIATRKNNRWDVRAEFHFLGLRIFATIFISMQPKLRIPVKLFKTTSFGIATHFTSQQKIEQCLMSCVLCASLLFNCRKPIQKLLFGCNYPTVKSCNCWESTQVCMQWWPVITCTTEENVTICFSNFFFRFTEKQDGMKKASNNTCVYVSSFYY